MAARAFAGLLVALAPAVVTATYSLGVRSHLMIAHSFKGSEFGPAQEMHGATYEASIELSTPQLVEGCNWVMDIGELTGIVDRVVGKYHLKCLDKLFDENTTTEFMCAVLHRDISRELSSIPTPFRGALKVTLFESSRAWASYCADVVPPAPPAA